MNGTATRARNREIRRAFGVEAIDTINQQGETLTSVVIPRLMTLGKTADEFDRRIQALEVMSPAQTNAIKGLDRDLSAFQGMSRWRRVKWVLGW